MGHYKQKHFSKNTKNFALEQIKVISVQIMGKPELSKTNMARLFLRTFEPLISSKTKNTNKPIPRKVMTRQTDRCIDIQTDTQTERQTDREAKKQINTIS